MLSRFVFLRPSAGKIGRAGIPPSLNFNKEEIRSINFYPPVDKTEKYDIIITVTNIEVKNMQTTKFSRQRETLLEVLRNTKSHPDADWIYENARREIPSLSLGTVYRNLSKLADAKVIRRIDVGDGREHYDADTAPHSHLVCEKCRAISDIFDDFSPVIKKTAEIMTGAAIKDYSLVYFGVCKNCLGQNIPAEEK